MLSFSQSGIQIEIPSDSRETLRRVLLKESFSADFGIELVGWAVCQESCARCGEEGREGDVAMGV